MGGEQNLDILLRTLTATLHDGVHVFATLAKGHMPEGLHPIMQFEEAEGTTLILLKPEADAHGVRYEFPSRMITLNVHSSLEAVGFIARVATELATRGMGVNPVSGFYHDHLFVPVGREQEAMAILAGIAKSA